MEVPCSSVEESSPESLGVVGPSSPAEQGSPVEVVPCPDFEGIVAEGSRAVAAAAAEEDASDVAAIAAGLAV